MTLRARITQLTRVLLALMGLLVATDAMAQNISVTAANPSSGEQDTVGLVVKIAGKNFANGARSEFFKSGTTDPAGVTVRSTTFVSPTEVDATIDIAPGAALSLFDIKVTNTSGRSGKGSDLFNVIQKSGGAQACNGSTQVAATSIVLNLAPGGCQVGLSGTLDCGFGTSGLVTTAVSPMNGFAVDLAVQSDGKLLALVKGSTSTSTAGSDVYVVRYNVNGTIDTSFGGAGTGIVGFGFTTTIDGEQAQSIVIQPDGKILVAANVPQKTPNGRKVGVARLLTNGSFDSSFGTAGKVLFSFGSTKVDSWVNDIQVQQDGRIVVAGDTNSQFAVARLTAAGAFDLTFATGGKAVISVGNSTSGSVFAVGFQNWNGQQYPILAGDACSLSVVRLLPNGTVDNAFGPSGTGQTSVDINAGDADHANDVVVDSSNRIVLAGYSFRHLAVTRLLAGGTIDQTFGAGGAVLLDVADRYPNIAHHVALDSLGRVIVGGYTEDPGGLDWSFLVARFLPDGTLDASFGGVGAAVTDFNLGNGQDWARGLVIQSNGRIVLAGVATPSYVGLAGFTP
jgi:uncharacterized delta-60 repeat protein